MTFREDPTRDLLIDGIEPAQSVMLGEQAEREAEHDRLARHSDHLDAAQMWHIEVQGLEGRALCGVVLKGEPDDWVDDDEVPGVDCIVCAELSRFFS